MKCFNFEKDHFSDKTFSNIEKKAIKVQICINSIRKSLRINFFLKFFPGVKKIHGFQDDIKNLTPTRYPVRKICPPKNGVSTVYSIYRFWF